MRERLDLLEELTHEEFGKSTRSRVWHRPIVLIY